MRMATHPAGADVPAVSGDRRLQRDDQKPMINILFLLTPKREVVWVRAYGTLGEAIERMKPNGFAAVPVLDDEGGYVGTLTEGDILWHLLDAPDPELARAEPVLDLMRRTNNRAVHVDARFETLLLRAAAQNFVPVLDDREVFIGIVRRQSIIEHCLPRATSRRSNATGLDSKPHSRRRWHRAG
jgi:CBS domain-containing protein